MSFIIDCKNYIDEISRIRKSGNATELSYYSALKDLIQSFLNNTSSDARVIIAPKKTESGMPDLLLKRDMAMLGYLEAKDIPRKLEDIEETEQIRRYLEAFPNLILTDFFTFWLYRDGKKIDSATLANKNRLLSNGTTPPVSGLKEVDHLIDIFCSYSPRPCINAEQLATQLAIRAKQLSVIVLDEILGNNENFEQMFKLLKEHLIPTLTHQTFADVYSQTLVYGLFAAKIEANDRTFERVNAYSYLPIHVPLLQRLFYIMQDPIETDPLKWILDDIVNVLNGSDIGSILSDFHTKTWSDDPVLHFYETFLAAFSPKLRQSRGVYYTPAPVVAYIIKSIQELLVSKFSIVDGFADPNVQILDPAAGSLTFPALAIRLVRDLCVQRGKGGQFPSLVREHILKNYFAFELLLAPYVIGHLKVMLTLKDLGYRLGEDDRFQLYLTNALEPGIPKVQQSLFPELLNEARNASRVKDQESILVICGNPPYSSSSDNKSKFIETLMEDYKEDVRDEKNLQPLSNDYIKFLRFAQWKIAEKNHKGIVGMITDNSYIDGLIHRGIRKKILEAFDQIFILNLHGNTRSQKAVDTKDENVFDIQQGVAIVFLIKNSSTKKIVYKDLFGKREEKLEWLSNNDLTSTEWQTLNPKSPSFLFYPKTHKKEYQDFISLDEIMPFHQTGVTTHRDWLVVGFEDTEIKSRIESLRTDSEDEILSSSNLSERYRKSVSEAMKLVQALPAITDKSMIDYLYRPFDNRRLYYDRILVDRHRPDLAKQLGTIFLITRRNTRQCSPEWTFAFVTRNLPDIDMRGGIYGFPLKADGLPNFSRRFLETLHASFGSNIDPLDILGYIYAILYCNEYRKEYAEDLRIAFPRIPITVDEDIFMQISNIGRALIQVHLLEDQELENLQAGFPEVGTDIIERVNFVASESRVYVNKEQYFSKVSTEIWNYDIGGYQVCLRWLEERLGRSLKLPDQITFMRTVGAIRKTIRLQEEIARVYPQIESRLLKVSSSKSAPNRTLD